MDQPAIHSMYYVAILCPPETDKKILEYKQWMKDRFGCIAALKSPAHITLIPPFWRDEKEETNLKQATASFVSDIPGLEISVRGFSHFKQRVLYASVNENHALGKIKEQVEEHFMQFFPDGISKDEQPFHPHITIATRDLKPADFIKAWEYFSAKQFMTTFTVQVISLLKLSPGKWNVIEQQHW
jgi:2'-5' RNA ligase